VQNRRGTSVTFVPDAEIFGPRVRFRPAALYRMTRAKAYLFRGVTVRWTCAPELIAEVDRVLKQELSTLGTVEQASLGGVQPVAEMLNVMDKGTETAIMSRIEEKDPILAEEIRKLMFVFEDIVKIDDKGIQTLLKEVPNDKLLLALKTSNEEIRTKIFKNISQRAANLLKDDLSNLGPSRLSDVETAQVEIVNVARRLETEGKILIARGGSEDALV
jgi:flagellar motor switch protein FliG